MWSILNEVYDYDRNLLDNYEKTRKQVEDLKAQVEDEKKELETAKSLSETAGSKA